MLFLRVKRYYIQQGSSGGRKKRGGQGGGDCSGQGKKEVGGFVRFLFGFILY